jgi:hypothetical protein
VQIINFKVSEASQSRLQTLLEKNREAALTAAETAEIDMYEQLDTLIGFLKIRAYAALQATPYIISFKSSNLQSTSSIGSIETEIGSCYYE